MGFEVKLANEIASLRKSSSVWLSALFTLMFAAAPALLSAWNEIPQDFKDALPHGTARYVASFCFAVTFLARITKFTRKKDGEAQP